MAEVVLSNPTWHAPVGYTVAGLAGGGGTYAAMKIGDKVGYGKGLLAGMAGTAVAGAALGTLLPGMGGAEADRIEGAGLGAVSGGVATFGWATAATAALLGAAVFSRGRFPS